MHGCVKTAPLGDQGLLTYWPNEADALAFTSTIRADQPAWIVDVVQSYLAVAVYYDLGQTTQDKVKDYVCSLRVDVARKPPHSIHQIPVCYDLGLDFDRIKEHTGLERDEVIGIHAGTEFTVYAIGFCPGFPFCGYLPAPLDKVPRLAVPRLQLEAGSVGLTGRQTGVYTLPRPGGWNIVGRTPLPLVDIAKGHFPLRTGDVIKFTPITKGEFERWNSKT